MSIITLITDFGNKDHFVAKKALNKLKKKYPKFWFSLAKTV